MAYDRLQPIGRERYDYLNAMVCYMMAAINSSRGANVKIEDFVPQWAGTQRQGAEQIEQLLTAFANTHNKKTGNPA